MRLVKRRELALALGARLAVGKPLRPPRVGGGAHHRVLEAVDASDHRRQQRRRVAAEVVLAQRELIDALQQHREAVGGGGGGDERVEPGLEGLVVQQPRAEPRHRGHRELLEAAVAQAVLELGPQVVGGGRTEGEDEDRQPGKPRHEGPRLARSGASHDQQRTARMGDDPELIRGEAVEGKRHDRRIWRSWPLLPRR